MLSRSGPQICPLRRKRKLQHLFESQRSSRFRRNPRQRLWIPPTDILRPCRPRTGLVSAPQFRVQRIVGEPARLASAEILKPRPLPGKICIARPAIEKVSSRLIQQRELSLLNLVKINIPGAPGKPGDLLSFNPTPIREVFETDQVRIACKRRRPAALGSTSISLSNRQRKKHEDA